jgi:ubiquinone/menaquinone biosynthesis C-methylase UbiE
MNRRRSKLMDWALEHITVRSEDRVLDLGCDGGRTVAKLAALASSGKTYGVDCSEASVVAARRANRELVSEGRVEILEASATALPFADGTFDVVTAVETHAFSQDLLAESGEVLRVLKPGRTFALIAESYRGGRHDRLSRLKALERLGIMKRAHLTVDEHEELLMRAGCSAVEVIEEYNKGWLCALGQS